MEEKTLKETSIAELISITGGLIAGLTLAKVTGVLDAIPGLIILIPAFLEMRGNISGALAARLGTALHLKKIEPFEKNEFLEDNIYASLILTVLTSLFIGVLANILSYIIGFEIAGFTLIVISLISGLISSFFMLGLTILTAFWLYSKGHDPDNIMGPYVTTIGDIVSVLTLILVAGVFA